MTLEFTLANWNLKMHLSVEYGNMESTNGKSNICTFLCFEIYTFRKIFAIMCVKAESGGWKIFAMLAWVNIIPDIWRAKRLRKTAGFARYSAYIFELVLFNDV